jgi:hypothetical protein
MGTGLERSVRWRAPAPGGRAGVVLDSQPALAAAGSSANAALTATALAKKVWFMGPRRNKNRRFILCPAGG